MPGNSSRRAIGRWLRAMGEPGYDSYDFRALEAYLEDHFSADSVAAELKLWRRWYIKPMAAGSRAFTLSLAGESLIRRLRRVDSGADRGAGA